MGKVVGRAASWDEVIDKNCNDVLWNFCDGILISISGARWRNIYGERIFKAVQTYKILASNGIPNEKCLGKDKTALDSLIS